MTQIVGMSGFQAESVGLDVGFLELPDMCRLIGIKRLEPKCRVCRVATGVERALGVLVRRIGFKFPSK